MIHLLFPPSSVFNGRSYLGKYFNVKHFLDTKKRWYTSIENQDAHQSSVFWCEPDLHFKPKYNLMHYIYIIAIFISIKEKKITLHSDSKGNQAISDSFRLSNLWITSLNPWHWFFKFHFILKKKKPTWFYNQLI